MATNSNLDSDIASQKVDNDVLFELTLDEMVNDFDDERTLEEEEKLAAEANEDPGAELSSLQKEAELPIEQLLAIYNCSATVPPAIPNILNNLVNEVEGNFEDDEESVKGKTRRRKRRVIKSGIHQQEFPLPFNENLVESDKEDANPKKKSIYQLGLSNNEKDIDEPSELRKLYPETYKIQTDIATVGAGKMLKEIPNPGSDNEDDYSPDEDEYKKIMVGSDYQAQIPPELCRYGDVLPYENEDKLLWDPKLLAETIIEDYLHKSIVTSSSLLCSLPLGKHLRDDEQSLFLLLQCGMCVEEAQRRVKMNSSTANTISCSEWSEEECRNFETGLRIYGKNFHLIQKSKVKTRNVGELVQFYYLWKKTERHDVFANKARLEKKKYSLDPGLTTDYMDRFLDEQESNGSSQHHSGSPSILGITRQRHDSGSSSGADGALYCQSQSMKAIKASSTSNAFILEKESVKNSTDASS